MVTLWHAYGHPHIKTFPYEMAYDASAKVSHLCKFYRIKMQTAPCH